MKTGSRVIMVTFNGRNSAPANTFPNEDFWRLIGSRGKLIDSETERAHFPSSGPNARACVEFDCDVKSLGLEAHNFVQNSFWIRCSDLRLIEDGKAK
jgi:hypothetical protein